jgi:hypothetical protein
VKNRSQGEIVDDLQSFQRVMRWISIFNIGSIDDENDGQQTQHQRDNVGKEKEKILFQILVEEPISWRE